MRGNSAQPYMSSKMVTQVINDRQQKKPNSLLRNLLTTGGVGHDSKSNHLIGESQQQK